jgi:hypothetical protein
MSPVVNMINASFREFTASLLIGNSPAHRQVNDVIRDTS